MRNIQLCGDCDKKLGSPDLPPPHCLRVHVHTCTHVHTRPHTHARAPGRTRALRALLHTWSGSEWGHGHHGGSSVREGAEALRAETQTLAGRTAAASRPAPPRRPAAPRQDAPGALPDLAPSKVAFPQPDWCGWVHCHLTDGSGPLEVCGGVAAPHCFLGGGCPWMRGLLGAGLVPPRSQASTRQRGPSEAPRRPLLAQLIMMPVCLHRYHISVVTQLDTPQIKNRHSTCFFKERENGPFRSALFSLPVF